MVLPSGEKDFSQPERLVQRLVAHLSRHTLWNSLLIAFPPLLAFSYIVFFLYRDARVAPGALILAGAALLALAATLVRNRFLSWLPSPGFAARLIDDRAGGRDRFLTLATVDPSACSPLLLARLREEAAALLDRVHLGRDFPYRFSRSFFVSCIAALAMILIFHLASVLPSFSRPASPAEKLLLMSKELAQVPGFSPIAEGAAELASQMQKQAVSREEERRLVRQLMQKLQDQLKSERQPAASDQQLLSQAAEQLREMGQGTEKGEGAGMGTSQNQQGQGKGNQKGEQSGSGKEQSGSGKEQSSSGKEQTSSGKEKSSHPEREELTGKMPLPREAKGTDRGGVGKGREETQEQGKNQNEKGREQQRSAKGEGGGKGDSDQPAAGERKPERFLKPGEQGEGALKGGRFVTVELPEGETESLPGRGRPGKGEKFAPRVPVSNLPLSQPDAPDAAPEKQPLPLEYRALIR